MKALLSALALLSFVAASTVPYVAQAATAKHHVVHKVHKKAKKKHMTKATKKKSTAKRHKKMANAIPRVFRIVACKAYIDAWIRKPAAGLSRD